MDTSELVNLKSTALDEISKASNKDEINSLKAKYLGKTSQLSQISSQFKNLSGEEKAIFGKVVNEVRMAIISAIDGKYKEIEDAAVNEKLNREAVDITLQGEALPLGGKNPFYQIIDEMTDIFVSMGFSVEEGSDVETDHYNFELLNVPKDHPARDMQDTFYIDVNNLLRTQTSASQAHVLARDPNTPVRIISPGKCYRRDNDDATHSHQFAQVEGLVVGKGITLGDLKGTLELFTKKMFGEKREIRLRSSYFPFTEPSVEVDVSCSECGGKGCSICKGTGYIEILGAGMVHPNVLRMAGYDPEVYSGFAFGIGVDRVALLRYGIDDIRKIYANDIRFLKQFTRRK